MSHHGPDHDNEPHEHDRGLSHDLPTLLSRRRALSLFTGTGLAASLAACSIGSDTASSTNSTAGTSAAASTPVGSATSGATASGSEIPEETAGPYPGDGSNGANVLTESGIVRSDIRTSFGSGSGVAQGVPLAIKLKVLDTGNGSVALEGAAVYLWHCTLDGKYSMYSEGITQENYLRGVQEADVDGLVTFTSIFPGAYSGRWPHIHFEVYPSLPAATTSSKKLRTSQLALPEDSCKLVYATDGYSQSAQNLSQSSLDTDNVFRDGHYLQLATVTGNVKDGMAASLNLPV